MIPTIGIRNLCESEANCYLNDLPEFTFQTIAGVANSEQGSAKQLIEQANYAVDKRIIEDLKSCLNMNEVVEKGFAGNFNNITECLDPVDGENGVVIKSHCQYAKPYIRCVTLLTATKTCGKAFYIVDGKTRKKFTVDLEPMCQVDVYVDYQATNHEVKIVWDTCNISAVNSTLSKDACMCKCQYGDLSIKGCDGSSRTWGIFTEVDLCCDHEAIIESLGKQLKTLKLYGVACYVAQQAIHSDTWSEIVVYGEAVFREIKLHYSGGYDLDQNKVQGKYNEELGRLTPLLHKTISNYANCCVNCPTPSWQSVC